MYQIIWIVNVGTTRIALRYFLKYLVKIYIFSLQQKEACEKSELERNKVYL